MWLADAHGSAVKGLNMSSQMEGRVVLRENTPQQITAGFISPSFSPKNHLVPFLFLTTNTLLFGRKLKQDRGEAKDVLVKGCKVWNNACTHSEAYARSHSGCFMKSSSFTPPEQLRGTRTRQTKKEGKQNKKIWIWILVWGKRGQLWKDLERGLICQISFPFRSCGAVCQNAPCWQRYEGGEPNTVRTEALNTHQKLLTLITLRALQLWHGVILAVTLID